MGRVGRLEEEVRRAGIESQRWRTRSDFFEKMFNSETGKKERERAEKEMVLEELRVLRFGSQSAGTDAVPLPARRYQYQQRHRPQIQTQIPEEQYPSFGNVMPMEDLSSGCGNCTATTTCACMEQAIASMASMCGKCSPGTICECSNTVFSALETASSTRTAGETNLKRPHSPSQKGPSEKRPRQEDERMEIDFTAQFARPALRRDDSFQEALAPRPSNKTNQPPIEPCGFCKEGTYCACADVASNGPSSSQPQQQQQLSLLGNGNGMKLPPLLYEVTPPPSDEDIESGKLPAWQPRPFVHRTVDAAAAPPVALALSNDAEVKPCAGGSGTCKQCLSDPRSGLFCRSLARAKETASSSSDSGGCCGSNRSGGGCCMDKPPPTSMPANNNTNRNQNISSTINQMSNTNNSTSYPTSLALRQLTLSCAQVYQTLSTHSAFDKAAANEEEVNSWIGHLQTVGVDAGASGSGSRHGLLEVEAATVLDVLKLFDRRFGRGAEGSS